MSTTSRQPYSRAAFLAAKDGFKAGYTDYEGHVTDALDAAHDRSVLGLDASAHIGDVLDEVLELVVEESREFPAATTASIAARIRKMYEANGARS